MTHQLTVYGNNVRVTVQTKGLNQKQASEMAAHFTRTVQQAILDAPHVGTMKEHQSCELTDDTPKAEAPRLAPAAVKEREDGTFTPVDRAGRPLKAAKKAKKGAKKAR